MQLIRSVFITIWIILASFVLYSAYKISQTHNLGAHDTFMHMATLLRLHIEDYGKMTPFLFLIAYILRSLVFFPSSIMAILSVIIFGPAWGLIYSFIGETLTSVSSYFAGKALTEDNWLHRKIEKYKISKYMKNNEKTSSFSLRLIPFFPFDVVNYASGLNRIKYLPYILGTMVGILPGVTVTIFFGYALLNPTYMPLAIFIISTLFVVRLYVLKDTLLKNLRERIFKR